MKLLNIGCGEIFHPDFINIDMVPQSPLVKRCDIRQKLPYPDHIFDACYSSHVLEHMTEKEGVRFITECWRILKPGGVLRVVVPDLEAIVKNYIEILQQLDKGVAEAEANYDWIVIEMYDQCVRRFTGGKMAPYLKKRNLQNKDFLISRLGLEAEFYWSEDHNQANIFKKLQSKGLFWIIQKLRYVLAEILVMLVAGPEASHSFKEGIFLNSGEVHRWMYDRFSLQRLFNQVGFVDVKVCQATESYIPDFNQYQLDCIDNKIRKPSSLFMEGKKP